MSRLFQEPVNRPQVVNCAKCKYFNKGDCTLTGAMVSFRAWRQCENFKDKRKQRGDRNKRQFGS